MNLISKLSGPSSRASSIWRAPVKRRLTANSCCFNRVTRHTGWMAPKPSHSYTRLLGFQFLRTRSMIPRSVCRPLRTANGHGCHLKHGHLVIPRKILDFLIYKFNKHFSRFHRFRWFISILWLSYSLPRCLLYLPKSGYSDRRLDSKRLQRVATQRASLLLAASSSNGAANLAHNECEWYSPTNNRRLAEVHQDSFSKWFKSWAHIWPLMRSIQRKISKFQKKLYLVRKF